MKQKKKNSINIIRLLNEISWDDQNKTAQELIRFNVNCSSFDNARWFAMNWDCGQNSQIAW